MVITEEKRQVLIEQLKKWTTEPQAGHSNYVRIAFEIALASLEARPVGYTTERAASYEVWNSGSASFWPDAEMLDTALYTAPPVPVMQPVQLPKIRDCCSSHIKCQIALQRVEEAVRAAGYEVKL